MQDSDQVRLRHVLEAARSVSASGQAEAPRLPWRDRVAMRHRLVHGYYDINLDVLRSTVSEDLPALIAQLRDALRAG